MTAKPRFRATYKQQNEQLATERERATKAEGELEHWKKEEDRQRIRAMKLEEERDGLRVEHDTLRQMVNAKYWESVARDNTDLRSRLHKVKHHIDVMEGMIRDDEDQDEPPETLAPPFRDELKAARDAAEGRV